MAELLNEKKHVLSGWPMIFAWLAMIIFAIHSSTRMVGAGDTWVAMACGRHFIKHGVNTVEPFSANSHEAGPTEKEVAKWPGWAQWITEKVGLETVKKWHPTGWINQNWLTHVIFYWSTHLSPFADGPPDNWEGVNEKTRYAYNNLVFWKIGLYILTVICVYYIGRLFGVNPALSAVFACFAMFVGRSFFDIRPAGFSNLLVAVFLLVLVLATYRNILYIWLIVPITVFWCNLHGGYIYAFIIITGFFGLHFLAVIPKRRTACLYNIFLWLVLYMLVNKFLSFEPAEQIGPVFEPIKLSEDFLIRCIILFAAGNLVLTILPKIKAELFWFYQIATAVIVFMWSLVKFLAKPDTAGLVDYFVKIINEHVSSSQIAFFSAFVVLVCLGLVLIFMKEKIVRCSTRGIVHIGAAGITTFTACLILNPFHLTNFTHTFIISASKQAKLWRTVHEWHSAFAWDNPVGTGFPFLVLVMITAGLAVFWILSRFVTGNHQTNAKSQLSEKKESSILEVFGWATAIFVCWIVLVSLSLCPAMYKKMPSIFVCLLFVIPILLSIRFNVHFIYALIPVTLFIAAMTETAKMRGYAGTYVFPFIIIPVYVCTVMIASAISPKVKYKRIDIVFVLAASLAAVLLMIFMIKPFKLQPYDGEVWVYLRQFIDIKRPWRPPYEQNLDFLTRAYNKYLFKSLYIVNVISIILWLVLPEMKKLLGGSDDTATEAVRRPLFVLPKIDITYIVICALTVYMAVKSRRFIPIAAIAACPLAAMFIQNISGAISSALNFYRKGSISIPEVPRSLRKIFITVGMVLTLLFGVWWGLKFKRIYLDPWPQDDRLTSTFMRMTASYVKPFWACQFIRENNISGNMFNYWTEGGFIAYGQVPDPRTGKTPLQLFMDGRAQAAYDTSTFKQWSNIMAGTAKGAKIAEGARVRGREPNEKEYLEIGEELTKEFRRPGNNVWVVLMPFNDKTSIITNSLEIHPDWALVFYNNEQKLFVDVTVPQGKKLFMGLKDGSTKFPDEFSGHLTLAHNLLSSPGDINGAKEGLDHAIRALEQQPNQAAVLEISLATRYSGLVAPAASVLQSYVEDFAKKKDEIYSRRANYMNRLMTCGRAAVILANLAHRNNDMTLADRYGKMTEDYQEELQELNKNVSW
ncbi:MAG: hypothetical protein JW804_04590 [Sedimentisphaerales bacterium]|nr:hypothetical protein [Sedimentisphaerales bacterium]